MWFLKKSSKLSFLRKMESILPVETLDSRFHRFREDGDDKTEIFRYLENIKKILKWKSTKMKLFVRFKF